MSVSVDELSGFINRFFAFSWSHATLTTRDLWIIITEAPRIIYSALVLVRTYQEDAHEEADAGDGVQVVLEPALGHLLAAPHLAHTRLPGPGTGGWDAADAIVIRRFSATTEKLEKKENPDFMRLKKTQITYLRTNC